MSKYNLLIFIRNIKKHKSSFLINNIGLSIGLTCFLFIYLWVNDELGVDKFHTNDSQLYQIIENWDEPNGIQVSYNTSGPMAESLAQEMPEVQYATVVSDDLQNSTLSVENNSIKTNGQYVSGDFFHVFSFPLIKGDKNKL